MVCEKCWNDAYGRALSDTSKTQTEHYRALLEERKGCACPPRCPYCNERPVEHYGIGGPKCTECEDMLLTC